MEKILAIDDNQDNLISLKAIIMEAFPDAIVFTALNGQSGIELAIEKDPDVILLDIVMPNMDGFEVCKRLKQDERVCDIPVVFITALKGDKEDRINALNIGAEAFLNKPIEETELTAQIKAMVKIKAANKQKHTEKERLEALVAERTRELEQNHLAMLNLVEELRTENEARRKTEDELKESETHFRTLANSGQALIWTAGTDKKCVYFNQPWLNFTGRKLEQELGDGWAEGVHPDDLQHCIDIYVNAFDRREKFSMEYRVRHASGEYRWIQDDGTPRYNSKGEFIGYIGHCLDITERKKAEKELRISEERLRMTVEVTQTGIWDWDLKNDRWYATPQYFTMLGYEPEIGFSDRKVWINRVHPDDRESVAAKIKNVLEGNDSRYFYEARMRHANGAYRWHSVSGFVVEREEDGKITRMLGTRADITERKQTEVRLRESEELFRNIFEYHTAIKLIIDPDNGNIIDVNQAAVSFYGWPKEQLKQMKVQDINIFSPQDISQAIEWAETHNQNYFEFQHRLADGSIRDVEVFSSKIEVKGKYLIHSVVHDTSSRKLAEKAVNISEARLKRAELASRSGNWELQLDSQTIYASEGALKLYGVEQDQFTYSFIKNISLPEYRPLLDEALKMLIEEGQPYDVEFKIQTVDTGKIKDIHSVASYDKEKRILFGVIQDITEHKQMEEALRKSEQRFKHLVEDMQVGVLLQGPQSEIFLSNPSALELLGINESQLLGKTSFDPDWNVIHEDGSPFPGSMHPVPQAIASGLPVHNVIMGVYRPITHNRVWLHVDAEPQMDVNGTVQQVVCTFIDITDRKKAEEALKESEVKFRTLFTQMSEGFALHEVIYDEFHKAIDYKILDINPAFEKQVGISAQKAIGALATELYSVSPAPYLDIYTQVAETGEHQFFQSYFPPFKRYFEISAFSPNPGYFATVFTDITERKRAEEALRESEEKHRNLFINAPVGIFHSTREGKLTAANPALAKMLGYSSPEELISTTSDMTTQIYADPKIRPQIMDDLMKTNDWVQYNEIVWLRKDHQQITIEMIGRKVLNSNGEYAYFEGFIEDITERKLAEEALKESEQRYRLIFNNSLDAFILTSPVENIESVNPAACEMFGRTQEEIQQLGRTCIIDFSDPRIPTALEERTRTGNFFGELTGLRRDGTRFPIELGSSIFTGYDGTLRTSIHIRDISARKQAEETLKENEARLRELVATKDKFFSIISHDLKSPFNSVIGFSNLLIEQVHEKNYEGIEEYAEIIQNSSQRAMDLLMNLLEWSRSQTGRMQFNPEYVEIVKLINEVQELLDDSAQQKSITISKKLPRNAPIIADKAMISTVLRNLISNAIKFTHPGGQIELSITKKQNELMVVISDTGIGIMKENIEKLFRIDESYSTPGTQSEKGTGLGLILCKEFVEKHGGKIWVESQVGIGSKFCFTIPKR